MTDPYQNVLQKTYDLRIPYVVHWELTYRCNLDCVHCYANDRSERNELSLTEIAGILDQLKELGCLFVNYTGGEVLLRKDLVEILGVTRDKGFAVRLLTNGCLLTRELAESIAVTGPLSVEFSLYAMNPGVHDSVTRVAGSHARTVNAIRMCCELGMNVAVKTILLRQNIDEYPALKQFAEETGARFVFDFMLTPADDGSSPMGTHGMTESQIHDFILKYSRLDSAVKTERSDPDDPVCGGGCNGLAITPDGDVLPCLAIRTPVGNLRKSNLSEIWQSSMLDKYRQIRYHNLEQCKDCRLQEYCVRCPGVALAECGDLTACSPSARMAAEATRRALESINRLNDKAEK